jgi:carbonic anhydrase
MRKEGVMSRSSRASRLVLAGVALAAAPTALALAAAVSWNHDPASADGPRLWGRLTPPFATCGAVFEDAGPFVEVGLKQSPIDIDTARAIPARLPRLEFAYRSLRGEVENTGHVVEVPYENGSTLRIGDMEYELLQFHFHALSEHTIGAGHAPLEAHLVHRNMLGDLAVVGVLMNVGPRPNPLVELVFQHAPLGEGHMDLPVRINARALLPRDTGSFYLYSGSLTTPPCSEGVRWIVMSHPVTVSQWAVDRMMEINAVNNGTGYRFNHRPVRPLNARSVLVRTRGADDDDDD